MKNTFWLYKDPYQIEIGEKEIYSPQAVVYLCETEEEIKNVVLTGGNSVNSLRGKSVPLGGNRLPIACDDEVFRVLLSTLELL